MELGHRCIVVFSCSFAQYANNGLKRIRVKFYIKGSEPGKHGTVHAEVEEVVCSPWVLGLGGVSGPDKLWRVPIPTWVFFRTQGVASLNFDTYLWK